MPSSRVLFAMCLLRRLRLCSLRDMSLLVLGGPQLPYQATPNYNWGTGDPYGLNYNYRLHALRSARRGGFALESDRPGAAQPGHADRAV